MMDSTYIGFCIIHSKKINPVQSLFSGQKRYMLSNFTMNTVNMNSNLCKLQSDLTMSHHQPSHASQPMDIDTEKIHDDSINVINIITKYHFDFNWKHFKAAVDALVHLQDIYVKAKDKADAELQNIQSAYYNIYATLNINAQIQKTPILASLRKQNT